MYIITYFCTLENQKDCQIQIEPPKELKEFLDLAESVRYHHYQIEYIKHHEIVCPRYYFANGISVTLIPWYLIPGRPYPIQIYLFACELYSSNPKLGQRGAAEATRIKFNLETFSHSTVCRSFKSLEDAQRLSLGNRFGEEVKNFEVIHIISSAPKISVTINKSENSDIDINLHKNRCFPSVTDTADRRKVLCGFLPKYKKNAKIIEIEAAGCQFVKNWHEISGRLLL